MIELHLPSSKSQVIAYSKDNIPVFTFGKPARIYDVIAIGNPARAVHIFAMLSYDRRSLAGY